MNTKKDGRKIVRVPLGPDGEHEAIIYADDYAALQEQYGTNAWYGHSAGAAKGHRRYVEISYKGRGVQVARLLVGAGAGRGIIRYTDGNPFNLCRDNLRVVVGTDERRNKRATKAMLEQLDRDLDRDLAAANPALAMALRGEADAK